MPHVQVTIHVDTPVGEYCNDSDVGHCSWYTSGNCYLFRRCFGNLLMHKKVEECIAHEVYEVEKSSTDRRIKLRE
jgi:hypothetical protein